MREVYEQNPKLGDAATLTRQLEESSHTMEQLSTEISKYEVTTRVRCVTVLVKLLFF